MQSMEMTENSNVCDKLEWQFKLIVCPWLDVYRLLINISRMWRKNARKYVGEAEC